MKRYGSFPGLKPEQTKELWTACMPVQNPLKTT